MQLQNNILTKNTPLLILVFMMLQKRVGIVIGMLIYGLIDQITEYMRNSILFLLLFFIIGGFLLLRVKRNK